MTDTTDTQETKIDVASLVELWITCEQREDDYQRVTRLKFAKLIKAIAKRNAA